MPYIITRANENNKVGKMGKGRKINHVQTIVVDGLNVTNVGRYIV